MSTSLSTAEPRPMTVPAPTTDRSRTNAWSPTMLPEPIVAPARTTAPAQTTAPSASRSGGGGSCEALDVGASFGGLPRTAPSCTVTPSPSTVPAWMTTWAPSVTLSGSVTPSPRTRPGAWSDGCTAALVQRVLGRLEHAHHPQAAVPVRARRPPGADALQEVLALDAQGLAIGDPRAPDVARAGDVLAGALRGLVEALVIDGDLALEVHVVERRHPLGADDGEAALLVGIEPAQVQVRRAARREAHVAEDDVFD